ncbi:MAG: glycogen synthase [Anaerolineae bacterium]|nr:glycogen synthase [Anaerolineae bacterium]
MQKDSLHILIAAAECRGLAKVGGLADVVSDLSQALARQGVSIAVVMPYYEVVQSTAVPTIDLAVRFGDTNWRVEVFQARLGNVPVYLLQSDRFFRGKYGQVFTDSDRLGRGPFEDDAQRFAFFSAAALELARHLDAARPIDVLHCHDWHTGALLMLLHHDLRYRQLAARLKTLFTIHNLDYQGVRPLELDGERPFLSFADWFPTLYRDLKSGRGLEPFLDPRADVPCFNPMRAGIQLADRVNTVSPTYAAEITRPDDPARNFVGGRGLERDLARLFEQGRLDGILNGLDYAAHDPNKLDPPFDAHSDGWQAAKRAHKTDLLSRLPHHLGQMRERLGARFKNRDALSGKLSTYQAEEWLQRPLVVAVTRAVSQKVSVLLESMPGGAPLFQAMLEREMSLIIMGTGGLEGQLEAINDGANGLFVCAFDPLFAQRLYTAGELFLMPSDFEPCGISQLVAMRYGCLPLVHDIGGLRDTVHDGQTGFAYGGADRPAARQALLHTLDRALDVYCQPEKWAAMQAAAMQARFEWGDSARQYIRLYRQLLARG